LNETQLDEVMSLPSMALIRYIKQLDGDLMILGIAGKIGVQLGIEAIRAIEAAGVKKKVIGVSRFSDESARRQLEEAGIETIQCDLLDSDQVARLPRFKNVVYMVGKKFGTTGSEGTTWVMNTVIPSNVAKHFHDSRIVVFSTGCVYDFVPITSGGSLETDELGPRGEYANSTVGRERVFSYYSEVYQIPICLIRLNYAIDLRYGVLLEIGRKVFAGEPVELSMGHVNVIWQGDVIDQTLLSFSLCDVPAVPLNMTGPETISVRYVAEQFASLFGKTAEFIGAPGEKALLNNASLAADKFGYPQVPLLTMIRWTAKWIEIGGNVLDKPTHFEVTDGKY
jgi:nucleoside-diphosphate-sugar epimerase